MPEPVQKALNAQIPLPYAILFMLLGFGGSGGIGLATRTDDLSDVQVLIREAKAEEMDHYRTLTLKLESLVDKLDRMEQRIDNLADNKEKP